MQLWIIFLHDMKLYNNSTDSSFKSYLSGMFSTILHLEPDKLLGQQLVAGWESIIFFLFRSGCLQIKRHKNPTKKIYVFF